MGKGVAEEASFKRAKYLERFEIERAQTIESRWRGRLEGKIPLEH